jgi:CrcB protein
VNLPDIVWVALAGSVGAAARFVVDGIIRAKVITRIPVGTIAINLSGSFVLGLLTGLVVFHHAPNEVALAAGTGLCGGFTTFSTASFETVRLVQQGELRAAGLTLGVTVVGALGAATAGMAVAAL